MLYLYSRIHFHKIEIHIFIYKKFQRSYTVISYSFSQFCCKFPHFFSCFSINSCRRSFFYEFLVSSLNRAVSFSQMNYISELISYNLYFHMSRLFNIFFYINIGIPESRFCFILCSYKVLTELFFVMSYSHPFSAPSGCSFYHNRISYPFGDFFSFVQVGNYSVRTFSYRYFIFYSRFPCSSFISHHIYKLRLRSYKYYIILCTDFCKRSIFR